MCIIDIDVLSQSGGTRTIHRHMWILIPNIGVGDYDADKAVSIGTSGSGPGAPGFLEAASEFG